MYMVKYMEKILKKVELIKPDGSKEIVTEEMVEIVNENGEKELVFKGLLEKQQKAENLFLSKLKSIGINSIEEYNEIRYPEEFSLKVRHSKLRDFKIRDFKVRSTELEPIQEYEKSEKFKEIEKLEEGINLETLNNLRQLRAVGDGYHSCNNTSSIISTMYGDVLYPSERCIWYDGGDRVLILKSNGTFGEDYITQSSSRLIQLNKLTLSYFDFCLRIRGSRVELSDLDDNYLGWVDSQDSVKPYYGSVVANFKAGVSNPSLAQIAGYWLDYQGVGSYTGKFYPYHGFVRTNIRSATSSQIYCMYGTK